MTAGPLGERAGGPLAGRVAIVSGGGRGLGRSFCLALARQGAYVVVSNRNRVVDADGRGPADHVANQIAAALGRWGRLDICVANAAIGVGGMFHRQPAAQFDEVLEINLLLPYALTQMTDDGMPSQARKHMEPDAVAPVLTALASEDCRLSTRMGGTRVAPRSHQQIARFFDGLEMVQPGLVQLHRWRPGPGVTDNGRDLAAYGGVGRKT